MALFVALGKATDEGKRHLDGLEGRHQAAVKKAEAAGAKIVGSYALLGPWDYMVILDCPDQTTALKILAKEASGGNVVYETFAAVPMAEFAKAMAE
ncbi:MAG: GYD domain-containing protein [Chloroflexota bacterium]